MRVNVPPVLPFEWFTLEVIARGNQVVVKVNDLTTADYTDVKRLFSSGHIALQQYTAQTIVEFRKIEIKELVPSSPASTRMTQQTIAKAGLSLAARNPGRSKGAGKVGATQVREGQSRRCASIRINLGRKLDIPKTLSFTAEKPRINLSSLRDRALSSRRNRVTLVKSRSKGTFKEPSGVTGSST